MSEQQDAGNTATEKKSAKKNSISFEQVLESVQGIPQYDKTSFLVVGHKNGIRLAIPKTTQVSRAYFYANGDYSKIPTHPAIKSFSPEERRQGRLGGIMARVDFEGDLAQATEALEVLIGVVRASDAPPPKGLAKPKAPKEPKKPKAVAAPQPSNDGSEDAVEVDGPSDDGQPAEQAQ